uniref:Uncharacterized protein n=1 Tax=Vannella robusta TaxID=1487602 RepID=A0A6U1VUY0_9EUKA|mmetsp:Transcript_25091/g.31924  ORF Transcript_25091/g.31924 Transcript_25091/m.31924 type:complete len:178 (+) Transcript_25091:29-562(+)
MSVATVHHRERRHHYVIHSSSGKTKHIVVKEESTEPQHRHHVSPRRHHEGHFDENSIPVEQEQAPQLPVKGRHRSCTVPPAYKPKFRPRRTVSEGAVSSKIGNEKEVHHYHHHHHYHDYKPRTFDALLESRKRICPEKLQDDKLIEDPSKKKSFALLTKKMKVLQSITKALSIPQRG